MDNTITYTNKVSTVTFAFAADHSDATPVVVTTNGKVESLTASRAEDYALALEEAGYTIAG